MLTRVFGTAAAFAVFSLGGGVGCSSSSGASASVDAGGRMGDDASIEVDAAVGADAGPEASDAGAPVDAPIDAPPEPTFVARFDRTQGQLPEGLWESQGAPIVGLAPLATLVSLGGGIATPVAMLGSLDPGSLYSRRDQRRERRGLRRGRRAERARGRRAC